MKLIYRQGRVEIWVSAEREFYVYGITESGDPRMCPSLRMAMELAAGYWPS